MRFAVRFLALTILLGLPCAHLAAWKIQYAEQFYRLYHQHLYRYPEEGAENIWYLSMALRSPFANPLNALAKIDNKTEWEKYRNLFVMHVYLRIIDEYLSMAAKYDKFTAYFYNYPWKSANLDSLRSAEAYYELALESWSMAREYSSAARDRRFRFIHLDEIQYWEDEAYRIESGELDYADIIEAHLERLRQVRADFERMGPETY